MAFCPPEGTHIVLSMELRIMAIGRDILETEKWKTPQDYSSFHFVPTRKIKVHFLYSIFFPFLSFPSQAPTKHTHSLLKYIH